MVYSDDLLRRIFEKTQGRCHLCWRKLGFVNYANPEGRGAWEVEHSVPRAEGGTDHLNNLFPAHIACNREKGTNRNSVERKKHGYTAAPMSEDQADSSRQDSALLGALAGAAVGVVGGPAGMIVGAAAGAAVGLSLDPERKRKIKRG